MRLDKRQLRPIAYDGLERIGTAGDGGYVVDGRLVDAATGILSLGLGYEWTFDDAVRVRNPRAVIIGVDPTIHPAWFARRWLTSSLKVLAYRVLGRQDRVERYRWWRAVSRAYFRLFRGPIRHVRKAVAAADGRDAISIPTLLGMLGDVPPHGAVVKMDIEGAEYAVIPALCDHAARLSMVAGEFHDVGTQPERFNRGIARLLEHFRIVHVHGNNCAPWSSAEGFPEVLEITFVHRALCPSPERPSRRPCPDPVLDAPNDPTRPDFVLTFDGAAG